MTERLLERTAETRYSDENRWERYVYGQRYSDEIVKLSQVRGEQNIVKRELKEDVRANGLLNPIDVGVVSEELLAEYIEFVHGTWGEGASVSDFAYLRDEDGAYTLLIAGHSRHQSIEDIEEEEFLETGEMVRYPIPVKIHTIESVWDIIRIQLGENIHSQPPKERQAIALVEAFEYGVKNEQWTTIDEFLQKENHEDVTHNFMIQALKFRKLPPDIRSLVLSGPVHYTAGVEMAQTAEPIRQYYMAKLGIVGTPSDKEGEEVATLVSQQLKIMANQTVKRGMNTTAAKAYVKAQRAHYVNLRKTILGEKKRDGTLSLDFVVQNMAEKYIKEKKAEIAAQLREMAHIKGDDVARMIMLNQSEVGRDVVAECLEAQMLEVENFIDFARATIGNRAVRANEVEDSLFS